MAVVTSETAFNIIPQFNLNPSFITEGVNSTTMIKGKGKMKIDYRIIQEKYW